MGCAQSVTSNYQKDEKPAGASPEGEHGENSRVPGKLDVQSLQQSPRIKLQQSPTLQQSPRIKLQISPGSKGPSTNFSASSRSIGSTGGEYSMRSEDLLLIAVPRKFTFLELKRATKNFSKLLGEGGFGQVYSGWIDQVQGQRHGVPVAVKLMNKEGCQGHKEWLAEVQILGTLDHPNLVKLIGFCAEDDKHLLVYELMPQKCLDGHLFSRASSLSWTIRMKVALGAARGLAYLHEEIKSTVIYRDLKAANILLDHDFTAKLSDFGLARDGPVGDKTHVSTRIMGTPGYPAPEYILTGHLTAKSDVFSFGVLLLELLSGRRSVDKSRPVGEHNLVEWAKPMMKDRKKLSKIMDPRLLEEGFDIRGARAVLELATDCTNRDPKARPLMSSVAERLKLLQGDVSAGAVGSPATSARTAAVHAMNDVPSSDNNNATANNVMMQQQQQQHLHHHSRHQHQYGLFFPPPTKQTSIGRLEGLARRVGA